MTLLRNQQGFTVVEALICMSLVSIAAVAMVWFAERAFDLPLFAALASVR